MQTAPTVDLTLRERFATGPVVAVAAAQCALLLAVANRYGYHRDELYFVEAGRHLEWGYVDQPPFTPFIARVSEMLFGLSPFALRIAPAFASAAAVVMGALIVRGLGGNRWAQTVGAFVVATCGFGLGAGHLLSTPAFDWLAWLALIWIAVEILRTDEAHLWLAFGAVSGLALWNKHLVALLTLALVVGLVADRRWSLLRTWWLPAGGVVAFVIAFPTLVWQATNGWPQAEFAGALADRIGTENRVELLPLQVLFTGPLLLPLLVAGVWWLTRAAPGRPFRALAWAWPAALVLTFASAGRPYYPLPLTLFVILAGVVAASVALAAWMRTVTIVLVVVNALGSIPIALPLLPESSVEPLIELNHELGETIGWPELVDTVEEVVGELPADERASTVMLGLTYADAGAIAVLGEGRDLPVAYSGHNSYADWRRPPDDATTVVTIGYPIDEAERFFEACEQVAVVDNEPGIDNDAAGAPVLVCRGPLVAWPDLWERIRHLS